MRLRARLDRVLRKGRYGDRVAVSVLDADGASVFTRRASHLLLPASTIKLVTAAAALARLGPDFRYTTSVQAVRPPNRRGVVRGDLVLVGGADPTLGTPAFGRVEPDRPRTPLEHLADRVQAAGVRRVTGELVADPTVFAHQPLAAGWLPEYLQDLDATRASGLTVDAGRLLFRSNGGLQGRAARDPAAVAGREFHALLRRRGVDIAGDSVVATRPGAEAALAQVRSASLRTIVRYMTSESDNHLADGIFRTLGAVGGTPTWAGSGRTTRRALQGLDLPWSGSVLADGSGLSRDDRLTTALLVRLQAGMWTSNLARPWRDAMALAGRRGTLSGRLVGTVAERRLYGKTGTLRDVRSLVGTVVGPADSAWHLAVIGNRLTTAQRDRLASTTDRLALALALDLHGCPPVVRGNQRPPQRQRCPA
ncbi:MAG: D-alanyl-D-alanine carboxypeptidase [Euzebyales bacterium]|nr:D-alanyl-D-alanine carboxypeptidase [Euzebyales bacterium]